MRDGIIASIVALAYVVAQVLSALRSRRIVRAIESLGEQLRQTMGVERRVIQAAERAIEAVDGWRGRRSEEVEASED